MATVNLDVVGIQKWEADFAGVAPTLDINNGIVPGDIARDTSSDKIWRNRDNTAGSPVWVEETIKDASGMSFTPAGNVSSSNVQDAIEELDSEKAALDAGAVEGNLLEADSGGNPIDSGKPAGNLQPDPYSTKTIVSGEIVINKSCIKVQGEDGLPDDLETITGGSDGQLILLRPALVTSTITIKSGAGNILTPDGDDYVIPSQGFAMLQLDGAVYHLLAQPNSPVSPIQQLAFTTIDEITVSSGTATLSQTFNKILPESGTSDDIDTISGISDGHIAVIYASNPAHVFTLKHGTGNLEFPEETDIELSGNSVLMLLGVSSGVRVIGGSGIGILEYKGAWDASANTPSLADGTGAKNDYYLVSVAGSQDLGSGSIDFGVGDWVIYNGSVWQKADHSDVVSSVFGRTGVVAAQSGDYDASQVDNDSGVTGSTVKDALDQIDSDLLNKADKVSGAVAGNFAGLDGSGNLTDSGSKSSDFTTPQDSIVNALIFG